MTGDSGHGSQQLADTRLRGMTRWSMAARCPRMAAYGLLGHQPTDPDPDTRRRWRRGQMDEAWFVEEHLIPRYGRDQLQLQKDVPWGPNGQIIGELHPDVFVIPDGMPFEIKSHADGEPQDYDYIQLCGEMHFDVDAGRAGALVIIDRDLNWEAIPVTLTDDRIDQVETIARQVADAGMTGELPDRPCAKPADGRSRMCPFVDVCFAGWQPPKVLDLTQDVATIAAETLTLDLARKPLKAAADEADLAYKQSAARLQEFELVPGAKYQGCGVTVKRTHVEATEKLSLKKLRESGVWTADDEARFAPFVTRSGAHDRWSITAPPTVTMAATADTFGDEAPWTDADLEAVQP